MQLLHLQNNLIQRYDLAYLSIQYDTIYNISDMLHFHFCICDMIKICYAYPKRYAIYFIVSQICFNLSFMISFSLKSYHVNFLTYLLSYQEDTTNHIDRYLLTYLTDTKNHILRSSCPYQSDTN
jgi:hypothetical protein